MFIDFSPFMFFRFSDGPICRLLERFCVRKTVVHHFGFVYDLTGPYLHMLGERVADFVFFLVRYIQFNVCVCEKLFILFHRVFMLVRKVSVGSLNIAGVDVPPATFGVNIIVDEKQHLHMRHVGFKEYLRVLLGLICYSLMR